MKQAETIEDRAARIAEHFNKDQWELGWRAYRSAIDGQTVTRIIDVTSAVLARLDHIGHDDDYIELISSAGFKAIVQRRRRDDACRAAKASKKGARHES